MSPSFASRFGLPLILLLGFAAPGPAQPADASKQVDDLLHKYVHDDGPGVAVLVVKDGKVVHKKGYGLADLEKRVPITSETTFDLASCSKQFTAMAIMILHDQGKLEFADDIRKFLPDYPVYDANRPIRVEDLLHHMAGVPAYSYSLDNNPDIYKALIKEKKLRYPTGSKFEYANSDYVLLALIVEATSGKPFHAFLHDEIFKPLGMKHSVAMDSKKVHPKGRAYGYGRREKLGDFKGGETVEDLFKLTARDQFERIDSDLYIVGDGNLWSCVDDLARWNEAVRSHKLLKAETWATALTPPKRNNGKLTPEEAQYGFGWWLDRDVKKGEITTIHHGGSWTGFASNNTIYLKDNWSITVLSNIWHFNLYRIRNAIYDIYTAKK